MKTTTRTKTKTSTTSSLLVALIISGWAADPVAAQTVAETRAQNVVSRAATTPSGSARLDSALRFHNTEVVTAVEDRARGPRPAVRPFLRSAYYFDAYLARRGVRKLSSEPSGRAHNVNALDEVPDSSWFENRIGARPLAPEELRHRRTPPPLPPFAVVGLKVGGMSLGLRVRDANGASYILKFDRRDDPDSETAADLVLQRLLWAVGYHTPEDTLMNFRREELHLDAQAKRKDAQGRSRPMTAADLATTLSTLAPLPDGSYRGLFSRMLAGVPVGGYAQEGVRRDDPNDVIPHEHRREVRGTRVFFSWLNQVDVKEDNVLDTWVEDEDTPGLGRLRHHLVDFGNSMGVFDWKLEPSVGFANLWDFSYGARSLVSFGLWKRPWEGRAVSPLRGVGNFESERFDPVTWKPQYPWAPYEHFDRFDGAWGARILMQLTPAHVAAAVAEGRYQDPRAAAYIVRTLLERQRKIGRHYLTETSGLDGFAVWEDAEGGNFCFQDLVVTHFGRSEPQLAASTHHRVATWDFEGRPRPAPVPRLSLERTQAQGQGQPQGRAQGQENVCLDRFTLAADREGYTIVDIQTTRAGTPRNRVLVHVARDPHTREPRVIGIRRL